MCDFAVPHHMNSIFVLTVNGEEYVHTAQLLYRIFDRKGAVFYHAKPDSSWTFFALLREDVTFSEDFW